MSTRPKKHTTVPLQAGSCRGLVHQEEALIRPDLSIPVSTPIGGEYRPVALMLARKKGSKADAVEEARANANLFVAASDMLAACEAALAAIEHAEKMNPGDAESEWMEAVANIRTNCAADLRAAVAKAKNKVRT